MHNCAASSVFSTRRAKRTHENSSTALWCREDTVEELEEKLSKAAGALRLTVLGFRAVGCNASLMVLSLAQACSKQMCLDGTAQRRTSMSPQEWCLPRGNSTVVCNPYSFQSVPDNRADCRGQTRLFSAPFGLWRQ